ncbi:sacsin [Trifolium medium]|uniref:Sacsin n=1 Tax=Trifolium medium TaxID=97028 RepID=A0A392M091_9FABA|nr:sacsin [Trifolium medium]
MRACAVRRASGAVRQNLMLQPSPSVGYCILFSGLLLDMHLIRVCVSYCHVSCQQSLNAEDNQYVKGVRPTLEFIITSKDITMLLIFNNEKGFSRENIESLCSVGRSTKKGNRSSRYIAPFSNSQISNMPPIDTIGVIFEYALLIFGYHVELLFVHDHTSGVQ